MRDFAQQIAHASGPVASFTAIAAGLQPPQLGDSASYLNNRTALRGYVVAAYEFALTTDLFGTGAGERSFPSS